MSKIPVALQLYTLRDLTEVDYAGTLRKVAKLGYAGVELAGDGGLSAKDMKALLDDLQLLPAGSHVSIEAMQENLSEIIDYQLTIGNRFLVCPWINVTNPNQADEWCKVAAKLTSIGLECKRQGIILCYHNHDFEFAAVDGQFGLDLLYANSQPEALQAELDLYWVKKGGQDPVSYINKLSDRLPLVHLKDMASDPAASFSEVGNGILDWPNIFIATANAGVVWHIVEQDNCQRPCLESVEISLRNLQNWGMA